ncbi:MAG: BamA/TamA family outer membrane protein [Vicinamibacterales bacterium]|nr:BamA/TamA family outer membrane protein [Vicinamibacterales bacterium]
MTGRPAAGAVALILLFASSSAAQSVASASFEVVTQLRIHGNYSIPDADVVRLAGVAVGDRIGPETLDAIVSRLQASNRFEDVEVRKRYTSLSRSDEVALILVVRERTSPDAGNPVTRVLITAARQTLFMPIVDYTEGNGWTYGARFSLVELLGEGGIVSVPLTLGGTRQAALELEKRIDDGAVHAVRGGASAWRSEHNHYLVDERRTELWVGADRALVDGLQVTAEAGWSDVRFGQVDDRLATYQLALELDTRRSAGFPRNAVYARAGWQWLDPASGTRTIAQPQLDARGFIGLFGQSVLALRALYQGASAAVPVYALPLLGGGDSVRGHRVGARAGDRLAMASAELRLPLSSPMSFGNAGVRLFFDTGAVWDVGERLRKTRFSQGLGAGVFLSAAFLSLQLDVGHDLRGSARVHFGTNVSF